MEFRHIKLIIRWLWLLAIFPIVTIVAAYLFLQYQPTVYEARTVLLIGPGIDSPNPDLDALRTGAQLMETYAELPRTRAFLEQIIAELDLDISTGALDDTITIRPIVDTQILQVIIQDEDQMRAAAVSNAVAEELIRLGPSNEQNDFLFERIQAQARNIEEDILNIENRISVNVEQLDVETDSVNRALLVQQIAEDERRLSEANNTLADLYSVLQEPLTNRIEIIDSAEEAVPLAQQTALTLVVAAAIGMVISVLVAFGLILLEDQVIDVENLRYINDLQLWGMITPSRAKGQLPTHTTPDSDDAKQYYRLGAQMLYYRDAEDINSVLFTSLSKPNHVPELVANLSLAIANTQNGVFLLDVDFDENKLQTIFDLDNPLALAPLLEGNTPQEFKVAEALESANLKVLPSGNSTSKNAFNLLASPKMLKIMKMIKQTSHQRRLLLVTAPPLSELEDALTLVSQVDLIVLVVNDRSVTNAQLQQAVKQLEVVGANVGGITIVRRRGLLSR